ncbi:GNAT family N-acetyltransferase [Brevundimonas sp. PAMC22021]|uniref:GNAT family N-acetyltransferase n=1 Tax=Brevundimonas sp. PAMC22021 TaxID=2861285 RepID=UPI001C62B087|nr:GNAT family N-acetyltransferase [Brevundimonas sp. PAMC22021]QYF86256.1 GNAT family N-acetyltransferase [Brevundimonas sp. PAMC22021]
MIVREVRADDYPALNRLHASVGWPQRSMDGWRWLADNPARREIDAPEGWVIVDAGDRPCAMLGNLIQRFVLDGRRLHGATGFSIIVPPQHKGASRPLIQAFLDQPGVFAHYTLNANARSAALYGRLGMRPWPEQTHALILSWTIDPIACFRGRLLRRAYGQTSAEAAEQIGERLMNPRLLQPEHLRLPRDVVEISDVSEGSPYGEFWRALSRQGALVADRGAEMMRWRLADPDLPHRPLLLGRIEDGRLTGTALAMTAKTSIIDPPSLEIIDLQALAGADAIPLLTRTLIRNARALGAAKVRLQALTPELLQTLGRVGRAARREGGWGHGHAAFREESLAPLWRPTPLDGDYLVCNRPVPSAQERRQAQRRATTGRVSKA